MLNRFSDIYSNGQQAKSETSTPKNHRNPELSRNAQMLYSHSYHSLYMDNLSEWGTDFVTVGIRPCVREGICPVASCCVVVMLKRTLTPS